MDELQCTPGPNNRAFVESCVMPTVSKALTRLLEEIPPDPVRHLALDLRRLNPTRPPAVLATVELCGAPLSVESKIPKPTRTINCNDGPGACLPSNFHKCGEYPVYGCSVPTRSSLKALREHLHHNEHANSVQFVVVGAAETLCYYRDVPFSAQPSASQLCAAHNECESVEIAPTAEAVEQVLVEKLAPLLRSGLHPAPPLADGRHYSLAFAADEEGAGSADAATPKAASASPAHDASLQQPDVISVVSAVRQACVQCGFAADTTTRVQHAPDVMVSTDFVDAIAHVCDAKCQDPEGVLVFLAAERDALLKHAMVIATLYFRTKRDVQHVRRLLNAIDQQTSSLVKVDVESHTKEVLARRKRRDANRDILLHAHIASLVEQEEEEPVEELIRRDDVLQRRKARRAAADAMRERIMTMEGAGAATRVQSFVRGMLARKKTSTHHRRVRESTEDFDRLCRDGRYPLVESTLQYLIGALGAEHITSDTPKRGGSKQFHRWSVHVSRIPPSDEVDVSSEDEEWSCEVLDRVSPDVGAAVNPLQDVRVALDLVRADDLKFIYGIYSNHANLPVLQKRGILLMERLVTYMLLTAHFNLRHKRHETEDAPAGSHAAEQLRTPASLQNCSRFGQFIELHREPLEWFANASFALPLFSNMPQPVLMQRLLVGCPTATGAIALDADAVSAEQACAGTPIFFVPDCLTADQWTEVAAKILKNNPKARRLLWLATRPDFCMYVNGVPFYLMQRFIEDPDEGQLPVYSTIRNAEINAEPSVLAGGVLNSKECFGSEIFQTPLSPLTSIRSASFASPIQGRQFGREPRRKREDPSWFGLHYDALELEVAKDLQNVIDADEQGRLAYTAVEWQLPHTPTAANFAFSGTIRQKLLLRYLKAVKPRRMITYVASGGESGRSTPVAGLSPVNAGAGLVLPPLPTTPRQPANRTTNPNRSSSSIHEGLVSQHPSQSMGSGGASAASTSSRLLDSGLPAGKRDGRQQRATTRHNVIKRQASLISQGSVEEEVDMTPLPSKAAEALATPLQTAEAVRSRLRRVHGYENALLFCRIPMLETFGQEWLANLDLLHAAVHDALSDPSVFLVCPISSPGAAFYGMIATLVWAISHGKNAGLGLRGSQSRRQTPGMTPPAAGGGGSKSALPTPKERHGAASRSSSRELMGSRSGVSASLPREGCVAHEAAVHDGNTQGAAVTIVDSGTNFGGRLPNITDDAETDNCHRPCSRFPCVDRLVKAIPRLDLHDSIDFVDHALSQTGTKEVLFDVIEDSMIAAASCEDPQAAVQHAVCATCALERYVTLVLFHSFLRVSQEQRMMMDVMQLHEHSSFKGFFATHQEVLAPFVDTLNPWEGREDIASPVNMYSGALRGLYRWRRRTWMPNIN